ncbi:MAG: glycosyl transferase family 2, partial [Aeromicrobium sp.]|nr:glycosyl transferase family 2 [Aeromicrobium sp.]
MSDQVTTVVITRDRREQLMSTLARHRGPVIVIDNGSSDGTSKAVRETFPDVRLVREPRNLGAVGRNVGARLATTPFVAFADDDSWWDDGALDLAATLLTRHRSIGLLAARVVIEPGGRPDPFNEVLAASPVEGPDDLPGTGILGFMACASVVRRDSFLAVGGFDPLLGIGGEEQLLAWDLAARGWALRYEPRLTVHHEPLPSPGRGTARQAAIARSSVLASLLRRGWPDVA